MAGETGVCGYPLCPSARAVEGYTDYRFTRVDDALRRRFSNDRGDVRMVVLRGNKGQVELLRLVLCPLGGQVARMQIASEGGGRKLKKLFKTHAGFVPSIEGAGVLHVANVL